MLLKQLYIVYPDCKKGSKCLPDDKQILYMICRVRCCSILVKIGTQIGINIIYA